MELPFGLELYHILIVAGVFALGVVFMVVKNKKAAPPPRITEHERESMDPIDKQDDKTEKPVVAAADPEEAPAPQLSQQDLLEPETEQADVTEEAPAVPVEEEISDSARSSVLEAETENSERLHSMVDPEIEAVAAFKPRREAFTTDQLYQVAAFVDESKMGDIVRMDYFNATKNRWSENVRNNDNCTELHMSMMLVNRCCRVDEITMGRFIALAERIVIELDADPYIPDSEEVLHKTQYLVDLIEKFDNSLVLRVVCDKAIDRQTMADVAGANHFVEDNGQFVSSDGQRSDPVYTVSVSADNPNVLEMRLDIALSNSASMPLMKFLSMANEFACRLDGTLEDVSGNPVTSQLAVMINAEMERLYATMRNHGIVAGSERARKLFARV